MLELRSPSIDLSAAFTSMAREFQAVGEDHWLRMEGFHAPACEDYLDRLRLADERDARRTFWVVPDGGDEVLAITTLQDTLASEQAKWRGHIGFRVRPSQRRRGIGTAALGLTLNAAAQGGLDSVLLVCLQDNLPARRVIRRNGGQHVDDTMLAGLTLQQFRVTPGPR